MIILWEMLKCSAFPFLLPKITIYSTINHDSFHRKKSVNVIFEKNVGEK